MRGQKRACATYNGGHATCLGSPSRAKKSCASDKPFPECRSGTLKIGKIGLDQMIPSSRNIYIMERAPANGTVAHDLTQVQSYIAPSLILFPPSSFASLRLSPPLNHIPQLFVNSTLPSAQTLCALMSSDCRQVLLLKSNPVKYRFAL